MTPEQIIEMKLPKRPTKMGDSRSKSFEGESVEVDAIDPETLRRLVREAIRTHVNELELRRLEEIEKAERQSLRNLAEVIKGRNDGTV